jgi:hypothetical protein
MLNVIVLTILLQISVSAVLYNNILALFFFEGIICLVKKYIIEQQLHNSYVVYVIYSTHHGHELFKFENHRIGLYLILP